MELVLPLLLLWVLQQLLCLRHKLMDSLLLLLLKLRTDLLFGPRALPCLG
jgi:hypothetical protein